MSPSRTIIIINLARHVIYEFEINYFYCQIAISLHIPVVNTFFNFYFFYIYYILLYYVINKYKFSMIRFSLMSIYYSQLSVGMCVYRYCTYTMPFYNIFRHAKRHVNDTCPYIKFVFPHHLRFNNQPLSNHFLVVITMCLNWHGEIVRLRQIYTYIIILSPK